MDGAHVNHTARGAIAESVAATWALKQGYIVCWPSRGQQPKYDLVIDALGSLHRVQVKRAYRKDGVLVANLYHGQGERYKASDIDVFVIVDVPTETIWLMTLAGSRGKGRVRLGTPHMERYRAT